MSADDILGRLSQTLLARRAARPEVSYTAKLFAHGPEAILKKIGEECAELIIAGSVGQADAIVRESADVLYHLLVLLAFNGLSIEEVTRELQRREGVSGLVEKAARGLNHDK